MEANGYTDEVANALFATLGSGEMGKAAGRWCRVNDLTQRQRKELARYTSELYAELTKMTVKQLRTYANQNRVPLGGASSKASIVQEMVGKLRHRKLLEMEAA